MMIPTIILLGLLILFGSVCLARIADKSEPVPGERRKP